MRRTIHDFSLSNTLRPPEVFTSIAIQIATKAIRDILKHTPSFTMFESCPASIKYPFNLTQYLKKYILLGPREHVISSLQLIGEIERQDCFDYIINDDYEADKIIGKLHKMHVSYDELKEFLSFVRKIKNKITQINNHQNSTITQMSGLFFAVYAESSIVSAKLTDKEVFENPELINDINKPIEEQRGAGYILNNFPPFLPRSVEFQKYAKHKALEVISYSKFKEERKDIQPLENQLRARIAENRAGLIEKEINDDNLRNCRSILRNLIERGLLKPYSERINRIANEEGDPIQKAEKLYKVFNKYSGFLKLNCIKIDGDTRQPLFIILLLLGSITNLVYLDFYIQEFVECSDTRFIHGPLLYIMQEVKITDDDICNYVAKFLRHTHYWITLYICGDNNSLAVPFLQSILELKQEDIIGRKRFIKVIQHHIGIYQCVRVEFIRCLSEDDLPKKTDRKYMMVFASRPVGWKKGFKNAKDFGKGTIFFEECEGARADRSKALFTEKGYTFTPIDRSMFKEILISQIEAE